MALKLLQPSTRPLGQFDLEDDDAGQIVGGEYVELVDVDVPGTEGYAADVGQMTSSGVSFGMVNFARASRAAGNLGGLADEGGEEYGTLFGSLIGSTAGRATQFGLVNGAVVLGPTTDRASGKVTVWAQSGLYGVSGAGATSLSSKQPNDALKATNTTGLLGGSDGDQVAIYVTPVSDSSLVSTTTTAVGAAAVTEYHAVFYLGNAANF